jgi:hypothetical protein
METTATTPASKSSNRLWLYCFIALFLIVSGLVSWFAPAYKQTIKKNTDLTTTVTGQVETISKLQIENVTLKLQVTKSRSSWSVKVPIQMDNGIVAYREAKGFSSNDSFVSEQVKSQLEHFQQSVTVSESVTIYKSSSDTQTVKRQTVGLGLGYSSLSHPWVLLDGRIIGSLCLWGAIGIDPSAVKIEQAVGGARYNFF